MVSSPPGYRISSPRMLFTPKRFMSPSPAAPTAMALPMTPYMWMDRNWNISWIRNQDATSDLMKRVPRKIPSRR